MSRPWALADGPRPGLVLRACRAQGLGLNSRPNQEALPCVDTGCLAWGLAWGSARFTLRGRFLEFQRETHNLMMSSLHENSGERPRKEECESHHRKGGEKN